MKALVVYDSAYGNTEKVAQAIGQALGSPPDVEVVQVAKAEVEHLAGVKLLVVGSPTQQFRPLKTIAAYLNMIPAGHLKGICVAAFDTRFTEQAIESTSVLAFFVRIFGYAAKRISDRLVRKGGRLVAPPMGFYVGGTQGPVLEGELERAAAWAKQVAAACGG